MLHVFHRLRRDEEGQTLVLAAVSMLILALAVMTTINIGQATYEKIRLQNTMDATAYSLAATQARVMNFYAYTNRAMICHYNSMMTFVSYLSYIVYLDHTFGRLLEILQFIPYVGVVARILKQALEILVTIMDYLVVAVVPVLGVLNYIYFLFQVGMWLVMQLQLISEPGVAPENDPDVKTGVNWSGLSGSDVLPGVFKVLNLIMLNKSIDYTKMVKLLPFVGDWKKVVQPEPDGNEARIVMTEIINSARHHWVAGTKEGIPILGRVWELSGGINALVAGLEIEFTKQARTEHGMRTGGGNNRHDQLYAVDALELILTVSVLWWSVTIKFNYKSEIMADWQKGGHGESLSGGISCRCCKRIFGVSICDPVCKAACAIMEPLSDAIEAAIRAVLNNMQSEKHHFYFGVTPYMKYDPKPKFRQGFNQPDYILIGNKLEDKMKQMYQRKFGIDVGVSGDRIDNPREAGKLNFMIDVTNEDSIVGKLLPGFNAISVARAYYHRPGEWKEGPNYFNPFWGAKLHPVVHHQLFEMIHMDDLAEFVITH